MPEVTNNVGENSANQVHDVALVQAMLRVLKNAQNQPYRAGPYTGVYDPPTRDGIRAFQIDQKLAQPPAAPAASGRPPVAPAASSDVFGVVAPKSATLARLSALLPATHKEMTIIPLTKTVHLSGTQHDHQTSRTKIANDPQLDATFRQKVAALVDTMYRSHKIVLWLTPTGSRRTFAQQAAEVNTKAGPGESNHNFGRAVDIGFKDLRWVQPDGIIKKDAHWLNALEAASAAKANAFWDARDNIALTNLNLHRLSFERVHLQAFDNSTVSSGRSLVALLNGVGAMKWSAGHKTAWQYKCDLGFGGAHYAVGTSKQIWAGNAPISKTILAEARSTPAKKVAEADIKEQDLQATRIALKKDFELADSNWTKWAPVP